MLFRSIRDVIMCVCGKNNNDAGQIWRRMSTDHLSELQTSCLNFQFSGQGQVPTPVITFPGALKMIMFLPGDAAKMHRSTMATILTREDACPVEHDDYQMTYKRKLDQLEIDERMVAVIKTKMSCYDALCTNTTMDDRAKAMFKDAILGSISLQIPPEVIFNVQGAGLLTKLESDVPIVDRFVDLKHMMPNVGGRAQSAGNFKTLNELKQELNARALTSNPEGCVIFHVMGFQYVRPRITHSALTECKMVQEAYGVEKSGIQFVILVMKKQHGVRFHTCCLTPYTLKLVSHSITLGEIKSGWHMSLYKQTPERLDCPVMDAIKQAAVPPAHKWIWRSD